MLLLIPTAFSQNSARNFRDNRSNFPSYLPSSRLCQSPLDLAVAVATPILYANTYLALAVAALISSGVLLQKASASL